MLALPTEPQTTEVHIGTHLRSDDVRRRRKFACLDSSGKSNCVLFFFNVRLPLMTSHTRPATVACFWSERGSPSLSDTDRGLRVTPAPTSGSSAETYYILTNDEIATPPFDGPNALSTMVLAGSVWRIGGGATRNRSVRGTAASIQMDAVTQFEAAGPAVRGPQATGETGAERRGP